MDNRTVDSLHLGIPQQVDSLPAGMHMGYGTEGTLVEVEDRPQEQGGILVVDRPHVPVGTQNIVLMDNRHDHRQFHKPGSRKVLCQWCLNHRSRRFHLPCLRFSQIGRAHV